MKEIAERIRNTRIARGLTQQELADLLGYKSRSAVTKIEKDTYEVGLEGLKKIAKALNVDPDYLIFGGREEKKAEITRLFNALDEHQQDAVLAFLRSMLGEQSKES